MNPRLRQNLIRLFNPRHIAFVGGADADFSARQCADLFDGPVWGVNPRRKTLGGLPCYASIEDLPEPPDAVFLATPRSATANVIKQLCEAGAGGAVCFTAGYGELGSEGKAAEQELVEAAGDFALVGPNCYGLINYTNGATLWPFGAGKQRCDKGIALIMQSGMISANMTMNDRSVPISYVISAGNQAMLAIEDYIDILVDDPKVSAIGIYIEGIRDINQFSIAAIKALQVNKPLVVLKAGSSDIGSRLTVSHTGSMAGTDQAFRALFEQLGIIRVDSPVAMLETLKFLSVSGTPKGRRIAAFSCSGGDAALLADYCHKVGLELPQPSVAVSKKLARLLPDIATVSNPLDYTTPLWGNTEVMPKVFSTLLEDGYDAAIVVQDFPPPHIHDDNSAYRNDANSFIQACNVHGIPGAITSDLPENIDRESREIMIGQGVTPLQGIDTGLAALAQACRYGIRRDQINNNRENNGFVPISIPVNASESHKLDEWQGKQLINAAGIDIPDGRLCSELNVITGAEELGYPVVLKAVSSELPHKSEYGAVKLNLRNTDAMIAAVDEIKASVSKASPDLKWNQFLVESMVDQVLGELLVGINTDSQFGQIMVIAGGGIWVELMDDSTILLLPTTREQILEALQGLKSFALLRGFRGKPSCDLELLLDTILSIARFAQSNCEQLLELDINPLVITEHRVVAADVMIHQTGIKE